MLLLFIFILIEALLATKRSKSKSNRMEKTKALLMDTNQNNATGLNILRKRAMVLTIFQFLENF
tara:strand:- start:269 stop:460 length:192 start_codon:yes stop_codon:yes gene_type:complete